MKEKRPCQCSIPTYWVSGATLRWSDHLVERAALCSTNAWKCAVQWPCWSAFHSECSGGPTLNSIHLKVTGCFVCTYCSSQWNRMHTRVFSCTASNKWPIPTENILVFCWKRGVTKTKKWSMNCIFYAFVPREQESRTEPSCSRKAGAGPESSAGTWPQHRANGGHVLPVSLNHFLRGAAVSNCLKENRSVEGTVCLIRVQIRFDQCPG